MDKKYLNTLFKQIEYLFEERESEITDYKQYLLESLKEFDYYDCSNDLESQIDTEIEVFGNNIEVNATLSAIDIEKAFVQMFTDILEMAENKMSDTKNNNNGLD